MKRRSEIFFCTFVIFLLFSSSVVAYHDVTGNAVQEESGFSFKNILFKLKLIKPDEIEFCCKYTTSNGNINFDEIPKQKCGELNGNFVDFSLCKEDLTTQEIESLVCCKYQPTVGGAGLIETTESKCIDHMKGVITSDILCKEKIFTPKVPKMRIPEVQPTSVEQSEEEICCAYGREGNIDGYVTTTKQGCYDIPGFVIRDDYCSGGGPDVCCGIGPRGSPTSYEVMPESQCWTQGYETYVMSYCKEELEEPEEDEIEGMCYPSKPFFIRIYERGGEGDPGVANRVILDHPFGAGWDNMIALNRIADADQEPPVEAVGFDVQTEFGYEYVVLDLEEERTIDFGRILVNIELTQINEKDGYVVIKLTRL